MALFAPRKRLFCFLFLLLLGLLLLVSVDSVDAKKKKKGKKDRAKRSEELDVELAAAEEVEIVQPVVERTSGNKGKTKANEEKPNQIQENKAEEAAADSLEPRVFYHRAAEVAEDPAVRSRRIAALREKRLKRANLRLPQARKNNEQLKKQRKNREKRLKQQQMREKAKLERLNPASAQESRDPELRKKGIEKLRWLDREAQRTPSRIINLDSSQYSNIVLDGNRPYYLFLSYTALTSANNCPICHESNKATHWVAQAHFDRRKAKLEAGMPIDEELPVYFVNIDVAKHGPLFQEMKLTTAPQIVIAPPKYSDKPAKSATFLTSIPAKYRFQLTSASINPNEIDSFVFKCTQVRAPLGSNNAATMEEMIIAVLFILVLAFVLYRYFDEIVKLRNHRSIRVICCVVGWCVYGWCISGGMYNIIKGNIFAHTDQEGKTHYISSEPRDQFGAEGLILGFLNCAAAFMLVLANTRAFDSHTPAPRVSKSPIQNLVNAVSPLFSPLVTQLGTIFFWFLVVEIYSVKNRGYNRGFIWY